MHLLDSQEQLRRWRRGIPATSSVVFVPTMGALHLGHQSLLEYASTLGDVLLVSIFVNPLQFERENDLLNYPKTMDADLAMLQGVGAHAVYRPTTEDMYPEGYQVRISAGPAALRFEGAARPGHFDGMVTVVHKLFQRCQPQHAVFGQKDAQQLFLVQRMVEDLDMDVQVHAAKTWREPDGLAFSSRNVHLSEKARQQATVLHRALQAAKAAFDNGCHDPQALGQSMRHCFEHSPAKLAYADVISDTDFEAAQPGVAATWRAVIGARLEGVHLLDNLELGQVPNS
ncbi:MAG: pantoate--beta-alanine ligase [Planctomycetota bacterium]|nr:pantoate--beta-alanine ligase [Planctomycetota bacterium]MDA1113658.1 pantoate--beta-alanine ligase [Planctomycetota bacterium]